LVICYNKKIFILSITFLLKGLFTFDAQFKLKDNVFAKENFCIFK
jgi:hypothetical protein